MENLRLGVSAVRHDMKREETVEEAEKNIELERHTPKKEAANPIFEESKGSASSEMCSAHPLVPATFYLIKSERWSFEAPATRSQEGW